MKNSLSIDIQCHSIADYVKTDNDYSSETRVGEHMAQLLPEMNPIYKHKHATKCRFLVNDSDYLDFRIRHEPEKWMMFGTEKTD